MMKRALIVMVMLTGLLMIPQPAQAINTGSASQFAACSTGVANFLGFEAWDACLRVKYGGSVKIAEYNDIWLIIIPLMDTAVKAAGYAAVGFIIWGGIKYLKSQGEPSELNAARMIITNAILGLVICVLSVAMVQFAVSGIK